MSSIIAHDSQPLHPNSLCLVSSLVTISLPDRFPFISAVLRLSPLLCLLHRIDWTRPVR